MEKLSEDALNQAVAIDSDEADEDYVAQEKNSCEISDYADEIVKSLDSSVDEEEAKENSEQKA